MYIRQKTAPIRPHSGFAEATGNKYRDRSQVAMQEAIQRVEADFARRTQHGPVRILMVDGKPGPDAKDGTTSLAG